VGATCFALGCLLGGAQEGRRSVQDCYVGSGAAALRALYFVSEGTFRFASHGCFFFAPCLATSSPLQCPVDASSAVLTTAIRSRLRCSAVCALRHEWRPALSVWLSVSLIRARASMVRACVFVSRVHATVAARLPP
jgi:hypothetical protein